MKLYGVGSIGIGLVRGYNDTQLALCYERGGKRRRFRFSLFDDKMIN